MSGRYLNFVNNTTGIDCFIVLLLISNDLMGISFIMAVNLAVAGILLVLLIRFAWNMYFSAAFYPQAWISAKKSGTVTRRLSFLSRTYPDKVRFFAWWLQVERLKREKVPGAFAEVGVYKGESARVLHHMDPGRQLHLFDTFEGFTKRDLKVETGEAATYTSRHFADTHARDVLKKIDGNGNIIIHKGYFPDTAAETGDTAFALVNLDADLYQPTLAALEYFYPRLSRGGVIFVHDYNYKWEGICRAVDEFVAASDIVPVLLPDADSTVILVKNKK